jgi:hypothetical protein
MMRPNGYLLKTLDQQLVSRVNDFFISRKNWNNHCYFDKWLVAYN